MSQEVALGGYELRELCQFAQELGNRVIYAASCIPFMI